MDILVDRHLDRSCRRPSLAPAWAVCNVPARSIQSRLRITSAAGRVDAVEGRGAGGMQRMVGREGGPGFAVGHDPGADRLGELRRAAARPSGSREARRQQNDRTLGAPASSSAACAQDGPAGSQAPPAARSGRCGARRLGRDLVLLQFQIEIDVDRTAAARSARSCWRAGSPLAPRRSRTAGRPISYSCDQGALVAHRVDPLDPRPAPHGIDRPGGT